MSATIDERIVEMKFDNTNFESNVKTTMSTLDKLKAALKFDNAKESLETINEASKHVTFEAMSNSIDAVKVKFSALEIAGITAISNLTTKLMDMGTKFVKSVSVDQISSGFSKYATLTSSIQTILAATREQGETMESVTEQMDKLSWFTDETSYSLTDMTNNIAKFTSNGIKLGDATTQMMGVSTAAALSGANIQDASHAMMGLSKAMASGMNRQTWSFIETAHMDTMQFKKSLIEAAEEVGTLQKVGDGLYQTIKGNEVSLTNFKDAMKDGWMTKDVMQKALSVYGEFAEALYEASTETELTASELLTAVEEFKNGTIDFSDYTDGSAEAVERFSEIMETLSDNEFELGERAFRAAQEAKTFQEAIESVKDAVSSGWMKTFELIFGNYEEAKKLWTSVANTLYDVFAESGNKRNEILAGWKEGFDGVSGRVEFLYGVGRVIEALYSPVAAIKEAIDGLLPTTEGMSEILFDLTIKFRDFADKLYPSEEVLHNIQVIFVALWTVGGKFLTMIKNIFKFISPVLKGILDLLTPIFGIVVELFVAFTDITGAIFDFVSAITGAIAEGTEFRSLFDILFLSINGIASAIIYVIRCLKELTVSFLSSAIGRIVTVVVTAINKFTDWAKSVELVKKALLGLAVIVALPVLAIAGLIYGIVTLINYISSLEAVQVFIINLANAFEFVKTKVISAFNMVRYAASNAITFISSNFTKFIDSIKKFKITDLLDKIKDKITKLKDTVKGFFSNFPSIKEMIDTIKNSFVELFEQLGLFKNSVTGETLENFKESMAESGVEINNLSDAIGYIIDKIKLFMSTLDMSKVLVLIYTITMIRMMMSFTKVADSVAGVAGTIKGIGGAVQEFVKSWTKKKDSQLMDVAKAILVLAVALGVITSLDQANLWRAVAVLGVLSGILLALAGAMTAFTKSIGKGWVDKDGLKIVNTDFVNMLMAFISLAGTLVLVAEALKIIEKVKITGEVIKTITVMVVIIGIMSLLAVAVSKFSKGGDVKSVISLLSFSVALVALGIALTKLSDVKWDVIAAHTKEIVAVMGAMALIAIGASKVGVFNFLGLFLTIVMLDKMLPYFNEIVNALGGLSSKLSGLFTKIMDGLQKYEALIIKLGTVFGAMILIGGTQGKGFKQFGMGAVLLAASFILLAKGIKNLASLEGGVVARGLKVIKEVFKIYAVLALVMSIGKGGQFALRISGAIAALTLCLYAIAGAIWVLGTMNAAKVSKGLKAIRQVLACFALIFFAASIGNGKTSFFVVMGLVTGVIAILSALVVMSFIPVESLEYSIKVVMEVMAALAGLIIVWGAAVRLATKNAMNWGAFGAFITSLISMIVLIGGITTAVILIDRLSNATWKEIAAVAASIALVIPIIASTMKIISKVDAKAISWNKIAMFTAMTGAILSIAISLSLLAGVAASTGAKWNDILACAAGVSLVLVALAATIRIINKADNFNAGKALMFNFLTLSLLVIVETLARLVDVTNKSGGVTVLLASMASICAVLLALCAAIRIINKADKFTVTRTKNLLLASLALVSIAIALGGLTFVTEKFGGGAVNLLAAMAAISVVLLSLSAAIKIISMSNGFSVKKAQSLAIASLSLISIAVSLSLLAGHDYDKILAAMVAIDGVMTVLIGTIITMSKMKLDGDNVLAGALAALGMLTIVCGALYILSSQGIDNLVETAVAISLLLGSLTLVLMGCAVIGMFAEPAVIGVAVLAAATIALLALVVGIGKALDVVQTNWGPKIENGLNFLIVISQKIGEAIGAFVKGIMVGVSSGFVQIGKDLSDFGFAIMPFCAAMKHVTPDVLTGSLIIAGVLLTIGAGEVASALATFLTFGQGMKLIRNQLVEFGYAVAAYATILSGIDGSNFEKVASASKSIAEMMVVLTAESVLDKFLSMFGLDNKFEKLGTNLSSFGTGIAGFASVTSEIDGTKFEVAVQCAERLIECLHKLPNEGGWLGEIMGSNDVGNFGPNKLVPFGNGLRRFSIAVRGIDEESVKVACQVASDIFSLQPPNEGGKLAEWLGDNKFELFGPEKMVPFANGLRRFSISARGCDEAAAAIAIDIASKLFALEAPNEGGFIADYITGDNTFAQLATELKPFGTAIKEFSDEVVGIGDANIEGAKKATELADVLFESNIHTKLNSILMNNVWTQAVTEGRVEGMNEVLNSLAIDTAMFVAAFDDISTERINAAFNCIHSITVMVEELTNVKSISLNGFKNMLRQSANLGINEFLEQFQNAATDGSMTNVARNFLSSLGEAFNSNFSTMQPGIVALCGQITSEFYNHDASFKNAGGHLDYIFKVGIDDSASTVVAAAETVVNAAADAVIAKARERGKDVHDAGLHLFDDEGASISALQGENSYAGGMADSSKTVNDTATAVVSSSADQIVDTAKSRESDAYNSGAGMMDAYGQGVKDEATTVMGWINGIFGQIGSMISSGLSGVITGDFSGIKDKVMQVGANAFKNSTTGTFFNMDYAKYFAGSGGGIEGAAKMAEDALYGLIKTEETAATTAEEGAEANDLFSESLDSLGGSAGGAAKEVKNFGQSIYESLSSKTGGMSFFSELSLKAETSADQILQNMRSNVDGVASWTARLGQLMEKGLHKDMVQTLADAGLDSYDQISAFLSMTDEQIQEANSLFIKAEEGRLYSANTLQAGWMNMGKNNVDGLIKGMADEYAVAEDESVKMAQDLTDTTATDGFGQSSPSKYFMEIGDYNMLGLQIGMWRTATLKVYPECEKIAAKVLQIFEENMGDEKDGSKSFMIGTNFTIGLARGISAASKEVEKAASEVAEIPEKASKKTTKEASPSKVAIEIGKFFDLGLAKGIRDNAREVEVASNDLANTPVDYLRSSMDDIGSYVATNIDLNPVIRPSLDISGISSEASNLARLFNEQHEFKMNAMQNDWSNPTVRDSFLDTFANRIGMEYADKVVDAINNKDMDANVHLEGDAEGIFKVVRKGNRAFMRRTGYSGI